MLSMNRKEITIFMPALGGGGAERIVLNLIEGLISEGIRVKLILATKYGILRDSIPNDVEVVDLGYSKTIFSLFSLAKYIRQNQPNILLSHLHIANRIAIAANIISGKQTKVFVVSHSTISSVMAEYSLLNGFLSKLIYKILYPKAYKIIHVSNGSARDLEKLFKWKNGTVSVAYNPVIRDKLLPDNMIYSPHPWFDDKKRPVILGVGRLTRLKNFTLLLNAFAMLRDILDCRLIILGDGEQRKELENQIQQLNLKDYVSMPGFVRNPMDYMNHASVFVLSSSREALPTVLIEALASGCPVVSTDCPNGPREILENGKYGKLVPPDAPERLSQAIYKTIKKPPDRGMLKRRGMDFSIKNATRKYIEILELN